LEILEVKKCKGDNACADVFTSRRELFLRLAWPDNSKAKTPISDMIDDIFTKEDRGRGKCGRCGNSRVYMEQLGHPPELLLVQVNRLKMTQAKEDLEKITRPIRMQEIVTLPSKFFDERKNTGIRDIRYELTTVIMHRGASGTGHFTIAVKGRTGTWKLLDDTKVSDTHYDDLRAKETSKDAHIFSYRRMPTHDDDKDSDYDNDVGMRDPPEDPIIEPASLASSQGSERSRQPSLTDAKIKDLISATVKDVVPAVYKEIKVLEEKEKEKEMRKQREMSKDKADGEPEKSDDLVASVKPLDFQRGRGELTITVKGDKGEKSLDIWVKGLVHNKIEEDKKEADKEAARKAPKAAKAPKSKRKKAAGQTKARKAVKGKGGDKSKTPASDSDPQSELSSVPEEEDEEYQE
jgi:hypothetical protein